MDENPIYGRQDERATIIAAQSSVVLIAGDSGVGKSALLGSLYSGWEGVTPAAALSLQGVRGALQNALMLQLGGCLSENMTASQYRSAEIWKALAAVIARATTASRRQIAEILVGRVAEYVEGKIGRDATKAMRAVLKDVMQPKSEGLGDRIQALVDPQTAAVVAELAGEVAALTGRRVLILLDQGERLTTDDRGLLAALSDISSPAMKIAVAVNSSDPGGLALIHALEAAGGKVCRMAALPEDAVHEWLLAEGIDRPQHAEVIRVTSGYPIFIPDAIRLIREGVHLGALETPGSFAALMRESWRNIDRELKVQASLLAAFTDPPDEDFVMTLLGLDAVEWASVRDDLLAAVLFISRPDGTSWFHERRRRYIWEDVLTDSARGVSAVRALEALALWMEGRDFHSKWATRALPTIIRVVDQTELSDPRISRLLDLTRDELAILWSLAEIIEPDNELGNFAPTTEVVLHAGRRAGALLDPLEALRDLTSRDLVVTTSDDKWSLTAPVWSSPLYQAALIGEIVETFGVHPLVGFAQIALAQVLAPVLSPFVLARVALGRGTLASHRRGLDAMRARLVKDGNLSDHALLSDLRALRIEFSIDGHPLHAAVHFDADEHRANAQHRLTASNAPTAFFHVRKVQLLPPHRVPYGKFVALLNLLQGEDHADPATAEDFHSYYEERLRVLKALRGCMTEFEAEALQIEDWPRILFEVSDDLRSHASWAVRGSLRSGVTRMIIPFDVPRLSDPLFELKVRKARYLEPGEDLGDVHVLSQWSGPLPPNHSEVAHGLERRGRAFNRGLPRLALPLEVDVLTEMLTSARRWRTNAEAKLQRAGLMRREPAVEGTLYVALSWTLFEAGKPGAGYWKASTYETRDGDDAVIVKILPDGAESPPIWESNVDMSVFGGASALDVVSSGDGDAEWILAEILGFAHDDVRLSDGVHGLEGLSHEGSA